MVCQITFEYFGFIFYFYSNEHEPIHVHVIHSGRESIFDIIMMDGELAAISVREKKGAEPLTEKDKHTGNPGLATLHRIFSEHYTADVVAYKHRDEVGSGVPLWLS